MYKVSVIVPVYNTEKYIEECLDSILYQTYSNIEVIVINDGSTDNSQNIIKQYENNYTNIKIINQTNLGVSYSRNVGISEATGDFIMFVDSDDIILKNYIEEMIHILEENNLDLIKSSYRKFEENPNNYTNVSFFKEYYKNINKDEINDIFIETTNFNSSCMQIINKKIIDNNKIIFENGIQFAEDFLFTYKVFQLADKIGYINNNGYLCRENLESCSRTGEIKKQIKNCLDAIQAYKILYNEENIENVSNKILLHINYCIKKISVKSINYSIFKNQLLEFFDTSIWKNFKNKNFRIKNKKIINTIFNKFIYNEKILLIYICVNIFQIFLKMKSK